MLIECDNCGAPLDVTENVSTAKCRYCGKTSRVRSLRTVALETPKDWAPPKTWTPPEHMPAPSAPLAYHGPAAARKTVALVGSLSGFITLGVAGLVAYQALRVPLDDLRKSGAIPADIGKAVDEAKAQLGNVVTTAGNVAPAVVCSGNEKVSLTQKIIVMTNGTPVLASGNCEVTLTACTVNGATAVMASDNAHVTIQGGTVTGKAIAVKATGNAEVLLLDGAFATAETALSASLNSKIELKAATVRGTTLGATTSNNATIVAPRQAIQGAIGGTQRVRSR